jgi:hypothetical protein
VEEAALDYGDLVSGASSSGGGSSVLTPKSSRRSGGGGGHGYVGEDNGAGASSSEEDEEEGGEDFAHRLDSEISPRMGRSGGVQNPKLTEGHHEFIASVGRENPAASASASAFGGVGHSHHHHHHHHRAPIVRRGPQPLLEDMEGSAFTLNAPEDNTQRDCESSCTHQLTCFNSALPSKNKK